MYDFSTKEDVMNKARGEVEAYFNKHPEYDPLLKKIDDAILASACKIVRMNDGLYLWLNDAESDFFIEDYVKLENKNVDEVHKEKNPVYKTDKKGRQVVDYYEEVEIHTKRTVCEIPEDEVVRLGRYIAILLRLNGFDCTCYYTDGDSTKRIDKIAINLGGTINGKS